MEYLGISSGDQVIYEGHLNAGFRPATQPLLVPIKFPAFPLSSWLGEAPAPPALLREDFFDPVTRIRRGRVFTLRNCKQPHVWTAHDPYRPHPNSNRIHHQTEVYLYEQSNLGPLREYPLSSVNHIAIIGSEPFISFWKIISLESSVHGTPILTLKSYRSLGDIPELDPDKIPVEIRSKLDELLEQVANSHHRAGAVDVVDRVRGAFILIFGQLAGDRGSDLGNSLKLIRKSDNPRPLMCSAADIINKLHSRGKPNEEFNYGTRTVSEEDAQLAIGCLALVLKEAGWAKS